MRRKYEYALAEQVNKDGEIEYKRLTWWSPSRIRMMALREEKLPEAIKAGRFLNVIVREAAQ